MLQTLERLKELDAVDQYDTLVTSAVTLVPDLFGADTCSIMSLDRRDKSLKIDAALGLENDVITTTRVKKGERISGWVLENNRSVRLGKQVKSSLYRNFHRSDRISSAISAPLSLQGRPFGVLNIGRLAHGSPFTTTDHAAADTVAYRISCVLEKVRLTKELARARTAINSLKRDLRLYENTASLQFIAGTVAHDINNPLTVIAGHAELLKEKTRDKYAQVCLEYIMAQSDKIRDITRSLTEYMEAGTCSHQPLSLVECLQQSLAHNRSLLTESGITVDFNPSPVPPVSGSAILLERVFTNLIVNAIRAMGRSKEKRLEIAVVSETQEVRIQVRDTGSGIAPGMRSILFKPRRSTSPSGQKTGSHGWGLAVCRHIIKEHNGTISVRNHREGGAIFTLAFPATLNKEYKKHDHHSRRI